MSGRNSVIFNDLESGGNVWAEKSQNTSIITGSMEVSAIISPSDALKSDRISESRLSKLDELAMTTNNNNDQTYIQALVEDLDLTLGTLCNGSAEQP
jgi:membrane-anchored protein YejM (alkaline phosphatase superfamily)